MYPSYCPKGLVIFAPSILYMIYASKVIVLKVYHVSHRCMFFLFLLYLHLIAMGHHEVICNHYYRFSLIFTCLLPFKVLNILALSSVSLDALSLLDTQRFQKLMYLHLHL